ncbi:ammonium transporter Rh type B-like [Ctenocephalides felis]|uniref:ammonium transporter Rh type B-like n=1 Tax=Ctenocephalides felis TaxID=7515 RepID=UPI000E6E1651|nr:ammonium transporter Rh type B-like [Ctenocephalides felis]
MQAHMFQDVHVMIFVGFGFLMTFLKRYGYSSVGFNLLVAALVVQWAVLCRGYFELEDGKIRLGLRDLIGADVAAASVLISMGALLGRTTWVQLLLMGFIEILIFSANEYLQVEVFQITDAGGSIVVHAFGAYFGLAVSFMLRPSKTVPSKLEGPSYNSDMFAMIGTLFLWLFWPSFNSAFISGEGQHRAVINTYLSLAAATVTAFCISAAVTHAKKFDMVHIQNSTLAGGVAVGSICNLIIHPFGAMVTGTLAGILSVLGYEYLTPIISRKLRIQDTCGVHNLHGMPAVLSGVLSAVFAAIATKDEYSNSLYSIFPAMQQLNGTSAESTETIDNGVTIAMVRSGTTQAGYQLLALGLTVLIAIVSGLVTGVVLKYACAQVEEEHRHDDSPAWELPHDEEKAENHHQNVATIS